MILYQIPANSNTNIATECVTVKCFKDEEVKKIIESLKPNVWRDAEVYQKESETKREIDKTRRSHKLQALLPDPEDGFPLPQITYLISNINSTHWNFDIRYINFINDFPSIFKYTLEEKFDWHFDCVPNQATRKLSYSIQLSDTNDYEGGDLEFFDGDNTGKKEKNPQLRQKGNIIVFPSYLWHRITPITKGIRYAIVGWVHGPTYR